MSIHFDYHIDTQTKELYIIDLDLGGMSVTNAMEGVLTAIFLGCKEVTGDNVHDWQIHYLDSTNRWDGVRVENFSIFPSTNTVVVRTVSYYPLTKDQ